MGATPEWRHHAAPDGDDGSLALPDIWMSAPSDYLDIFEDDDRQLPAAPAVSPVRPTGGAGHDDDRQLAVAPAVAPAGPTGRAGQGVGRGRHGGPWERRLLCQMMTSRKATRRLQTHEQTQACVLRDFVQHVAAPSLSRKRPRVAQLTVRVGKNTRAARAVGGATDVLKLRHLRIIFRNPGGKREVIPPATVLDSAFDESTSQRATASKFGLSQRSLCRASITVSCAYLHTQGRLLERMLHVFSNFPPTFMVRHMAWDETGQTLGALDVSVGGAWSQTTQIMVCRVKLVWGWLKEGEPPLRPMSLEIIIPPVAVTSTSAESLYHGLLHSPLAAQTHRQVRAMLNMADIPVSICEADAAPANAKLFAHMLDTDSVGHERALLSDLKLCHLHQNHLVLTGVISILGSTLVGRLYSLAVLLRCCGNFLRLHRAVAPCVRSTYVAIVPGPRPTPDAVLDYNLEALHYVLGQAGSVAHENTDGHNFEGGGAPAVAREILALKPVDLLDVPRCKRLIDSTGRRTSAQHVLVAILAFMQISHGPMWEPAVVHKCRGLTCEACGGNDEAAVQAAQLALRKLLLRVLPSVPVANKWTKMTPCVQFVVSGLLLHNLLPRLFQSAFQATTATTEPALSTQWDPAQQEELNFHEVQGIRMTRTRAFLDDHEMRVKLVILALALEPLQWLTSCFLQNSQEVSNYSRPPFIMDLLSSSHSPIIVVLQYFSTLLRGVGSRRQGREDPLPP